MNLSRDILDAFDHLSDFDDVDFKDFDFTKTTMSLGELLSYEDYDSWGEIEKNEFQNLSKKDVYEILKSYRGEHFAKRAISWIENGTFPSVVLFEDYGILGDGRGRINVAVGMGWNKIPVILVTKKTMIRETIHLLIREFFDQKIGRVGLVTAQNPQEKQQDLDKNRSVNDRLLDDLTSMGFEPMPTHYYGEEGFIIPNISKSQLIELGRKYNQRAVIWAKKVPEDRNGMTFNWEYLEDGKIRNEKISHHPFVCPNFS